MPVLLLACATETPTNVEAPPIVPTFAKGPASTVDSRARVQWDDALAIRSDNGTAYEGGVQGVNARLFYYDINGSRSGDLVFDPDGNSGQRKLVFHFPSGPVATGTAFNFSALMQLGSTARDSIMDVKNPGWLSAAAFPDWTAVQPDYPNRAKPHPNFRFKATGISGCGELDYAMIRLTRLAGSFVPTTNDMGKWVYEQTAGSWVVESVATSNAAGVSGHWATCLTTVKGKLQSNGTFDMPFRVTVDELR